MRLGFLLAFGVPAAAIASWTAVSNPASGTPADDAARVRCATRLSLSLTGRPPSAALLASADPQAEIETLLAETSAAGERCLLIVDEVQNMPFPALEELRMLSNIEVPDGAPLQTILVGQPEFLLAQRQ